MLFAAPTNNFGKISHKMPGVFGNQISAVDVNMENSTTVTDDFDYVKFAMDHVFGPNFNPADVSLKC